MKEKKKKWIRPQLIVLGRGTPEENVLAGCKTSKLAAKNATLKSCKKKSTKTVCAGGKCSIISTSS